MSTKIRIWDKQSIWPSVIAVFSITLLAQIPHFFYLHNIVEFNNWENLSLLFAFPVFSAIGLSAASLLISEALMNRVRDERERKLYRYLIRGSFFTILLYFFIQIFIVFFGFEAIPVIRGVMPTNIIDSVTFKEIFGMSLVLLISIFINPPIELPRRRKK